jgi:hypothetical protein
LGATSILGLTRLLYLVALAGILADCHVGFGLSMSSARAVKVRKGGGSRMGCVRRLANRDRFLEIWDCAVVPVAMFGAYSSVWLLIWFESCDENGNRRQKREKGHATMESGAGVGCTQE